MSARARVPYQRIPQAEVAALSTPGSDVSAHVGSFDDDHDDGDSSELSHDDDDDGDDADEHDTLKKKQRKRSQQAAAWSTKLHALVWVLAAVGVAYSIDFVRVVFTDPRVKRGYLHFGLVCAGINMCITAYLAIYLPYIKRVHLEWSVYCPRMIPTATLVGVLATFAFLAALWPIWGLFTPGLLALFFIGTLMTAHFLPSI